MLHHTPQLLLFSFAVISLSELFLSLILSNKMNKGISQYIPGSIVAEEWEYIDPTPDIHALFIQFDERFFWGALKGVVVKWSPRMTLCAGLCRYEGRSGMCSISLSEPLLKLRPRKDLVETLLHEMIHAYLFVTANNRDREGHGPEFQSHMHRINNESGTKITIYHSFHDEVRLYKQHWWKCNGPCQHRPPFFGTVKRSMNRAPGPNDTWWAQHQASCNGSFIKIKEPENFGVKKRKVDSEKEKEAKKVKTSGVRDIRNFFKSPEKKNGTSSGNPIAGPSNSSSRKGFSSSFEAKADPSARGAAVSSSKNSGSASGQSKSFSGTALKNKGSSTVVLKDPNCDKPGSSQETKPTSTPFIPFQGKGHVLGGSSKTEKPREVIDLESELSERYVTCPSCPKRVPESSINAHLDECLT